MKVLITYEYLSLCFNSNALYTTAGPGRVRTYLSGWHYGFKGAIQPSKLGPALPSLPGQSARYSHYTVLPAPGAPVHTEELGARVLKA